MHSIEFDLSLDLLKSAFAATLITFFLGIAAARWMIGYRGKRGLMKDFYLSSSFAANCSRLLLLLVFGKTGRWTAIASIRSDSRFLACNGDYSHSGCLPLMYKTAQGALNKSMLVFFGLNSWGVGSNSILAGHSLSWPGIVAGTVLSCPFG